MTIILYENGQWFHAADWIHEKDNPALEGLNHWAKKVPSYINCESELDTWLTEQFNNIPRGV